MVNGPGVNKLPPNTGADNKAALTLAQLTKLLKGDVNKNSTMFFVYLNHIDNMVQLMMMQYLVVNQQMTNGTRDMIFNANIHSRLF